MIAKLATLSFQEGCFPHSFKTALITPVIKKLNLDPNNLSNYRPISNLNNISKIMEKLFLSRLQPHILASSNFNPYQSLTAAITPLKQLFFVLLIMLPTLPTITNIFSLSLSTSVLPLIPSTTEASWIVSNQLLESLKLLYNGSPHIS